MTKTKKLLALIIIPIVVAVAAGAFFFISRSRSAYLNALPGEVKALARFDLPTFADEADVPVEAFVDFVRHSRSMEKVASGIDFSRPLYAFAASSGYFGLTAAVADDDAFAALCEEMHAQGRASAISRQRGFSWVTLLDQWLCAFDGSRALVMGPAVGSAQDQLRTEMARLLSQNKDVSGQEGDYFKQLSKHPGAAVAMVGPELFPPRPRLLLYKAGIRSHDDALIRLQLTTRNNELQLVGGVEAFTDEAKQHMEQLGNVLRPMQGELAAHAHRENCGWLGMNIEGSKLLNYMRYHRGFRSALIAMNLAFDLDNILSSIDGDVALEFTPDFSPSPSKLVNFDFHGIYLTARLDDTRCFDGSASWGNNYVDVKRLGQFDYALTLGREHYYLGASDNILYLGSERGLAAGGNKELTSATVAGKRFYATFATPHLFKLLSGLTTVPPALRKFERVTLDLDQTNTAHLRLLAPEGTHIVKELLSNE